MIDETMKIFYGIALAVCGAAVLAFAVEPGASLIDNEYAKVVRALEKPHVKGSVHDHKVNRVMVYMQNGRQRFDYQDGRASATFNWKAGQVVWSKAEGMHSPEVVSDDPFNIVEVELKKPGSGRPISRARDVLTVDPRHYDLEFENDQVRVLRLKLSPHESTAALPHPLNRIAVFMTATGDHKAGDAIWQTAGEYKDENPGANAIEMVLIEVKD